MSIRPTVLNAVMKTIAQEGRNPYLATGIVQTSAREREKVARPRRQYRMIRKNT